MNKIHNKIQWRLKHRNYNKYKNKGIKIILKQVFLSKFRLIKTTLIYNSHQ